MMSLDNLRIAEQAGKMDGTSYSMLPNDALEMSRILFDF
jgi:hypothetical protein